MIRVHKLAALYGVTILGLALTSIFHFFLHSDLATRTTTECLQDLPELSPFHQEAPNVTAVDVDVDVDGSVEDGGTSACLLVMDDNHYLIEWLAYHYHVANLRHLIITSDPDSMTTPTEVLDRWRGRMKIEEWDDSRFLPKYFESQVKNLATSNNKSRSLALTRHRQRQQKFNLACLRELKRQDRGWVLMIDTDEYLRPNPSLLEQGKIGKYGYMPPISEPGSVFAALSRTMIPNKRFRSVTSPCIHVHRKQFSAEESPMEAVENLVPESFNALNFQTMRWRKYGFMQYAYKTKFGKVCSKLPMLPGKVVIDLKRLRPIDLDDYLHTGNPHRPLDICPPLNTGEKMTPIFANHYMGTPEQWLYRAGDKRGKGFRQAKYEDLNKKIGAAESDEVRSWLSGFVETVGKKEAQKLLSGVGMLETISQPVTENSTDVAPVEEHVYKVGDVVQANWDGYGRWIWAEVSAVHSNGYYNVFHTSTCNEEIATFAARLRREGTADDSETNYWDMANQQTN